MTKEQTEVETISIIGMGCQFPGAKGLAEFWDLLRNGEEAITEVPPDRWNADTFYDPDPEVRGKINSRWGGFLPDADMFDPEFFGIDPDEAQRIDPQQRLVLEVAWEALESAGVIPADLSGSETGVFIGISHSDHGRKLNRYILNIDSNIGPHFYHSFAANRLSYVLNLRGPSMAIDTACSSSLTAMHIACQSLRSGECELAIVGGVNMHLLPEESIYTSLAGLLSADGHCKSFSEGGDGFARSEGCGIVVLKRTQDALQDNNNILAVIRGSAVNHNGLSNGITVPNGPSQQALICKALKNAAVSPADIDYVEAHGTGTSKGDSIEIDALQTVLKEGRTQDQICRIGTVKTNIGHLEAASGVASVIKVILSLMYEAIPPLLHLKTLNRYINLDGTPFSIPTELQPWPNNKIRRRLAGISSFGFGGANCHLTLEEPIISAIPAIECERPHNLLTLSAKDDQALRDMAQRYVAYLTINPDANIADICFTANTGRSSFEYRLAVIANSSAILKQRLNTFISGEMDPFVSTDRVSRRKRPRVAFIFRDDCPESVVLSLELYRTQPVFRKSIEHCDKILRTDFKVHLIDELYLDRSKGAELDNATSISQVHHEIVIFAVQYALSELWQSWGIKPKLVVGKGVGEYVAGCIAGVFSMEDALQLIMTNQNITEVISQTGEKRNVDQKISIHEPGLPMISILDKELVKEELSDHNRWLRCVDTLENSTRIEQVFGDHKIGILLEIGSNAVSKEKDVGSISLGRNSKSTNYLLSLMSGKGAWQQMLDTLSCLFLKGVVIDWAGFDSDFIRKRLQLPTYPFQKQHYWFDLAEAPNNKAAIAELGNKL